MILFRVTSLGRTIILCLPLPLPLILYERELCLSLREKNADVGYLKAKCRSTKDVAAKNR